MVDFSKPVQTRDGSKVRILCTDANISLYPIIALVSVGNRERCASYTTNGKKYENCGTAPDDLINVPQPRKHADVIKAWADGAEVQARMGEHDVWIDMPCPRFEESLQYRVKP